jgi:crossover junction endodeoxyribonuclease RuvC
MSDGPIIQVLGIDPGFASVGIAVVRLHPVRETVMQLGVLHTAKSGVKQNVLAADDNLRRARELFDALNLHMAWVTVICAESMSFPRNSQAAAKVAMAWGVIASLAQWKGLPIVQASPQTIKKAVCGVKSASKEDVQQALRMRYGEMPGVAELAKGELEHAFDALAAVVCCLDSEVVRMARKMAA